MRQFNTLSHFDILPHFDKTKRQKRLEGKPLGHFCQKRKIKNYRPEKNF